MANMFFHQLIGLFASPFSALDEHELKSCTRNFSRSIKGGLAQVTISVLKSSWKNQKDLLSVIY
uniref:Uncharacterized protein n=1 Tax=Rhizophora mucronata TaxID=61149 RepID=A0A2P2QRI3_RHIMU